MASTPKRASPTQSQPPIAVSAPDPSALDAVVNETRNRINRPSFLRSIFIIRLINAWWITTFFQPDEYFQALEPAWNLAFGPQSGAWLTWVRLSDCCFLLCQLPLDPLFPIIAYS